MVMSFGKWRHVELQGLTGTGVGTGQGEKEITEWRQRVRDEWLDVGQGDQSIDH